MRPMAILKAIIAGERDPVTLAKLRNPHCQHDADEIAKALQGTWRAEHLFALRQAVELYAFSHQQITQCDQQIKAHLETFGDTSAGQPLPPKARRHKKTNEPRFDARTPLSRMAGVDLTTIEGIEEGTALVILSEIGTDMHRWPSVKHFCSWLGLCPQHQISGGKVLSRRVRPGAHRVTVALRLAARSLHHSQSALGAFFRRMKARPDQLQHEPEHETARGVREGLPPAHTSVLVHLIVAEVDERERIDVRTRRGRHRGEHEDHDEDRRK
jgi:transposase